MSDLSSAAFSNKKINFTALVPFGKSNFSTTWGNLSHINLKFSFFFRIKDLGREKIIFHRIFSHFGKAIFIITRFFKSFSVAHSTLV